MPLAPTAADRTPRGRTLSRDSRAADPASDRPPAVPTGPVPRVGELRRRFPMTREQYRVFEEAQTENKFEWSRGEAIEVAGATAEHDILKTDLFGLLWSSLRGRPGRVFSSDMRVRIPSGPYRYPDLSAVTGAPEFERHPKDKKLVLSNPALLFEALSESTAEEDEGEKLDEYTLIPSLTDYVIAESRAVRVVHRTRTAPDRPWEERVLKAPAATLELPALGFRATLAEIYAGLDLLDPPAVRS